MALAGILVVFSYTMLWFYMAGQFAEGVERWAAERRARGQFATMDTRVAGGFPLKLRVAVDQPELGGRNRTASWAWIPPPMEIEVNLFRWSRPVFRMSGRHEIAVFSGDGAQQSYAGEIADLVGQVSLEDNRVRMVELFAGDLRLAGGGPVPYSARTLDIIVDLPPRAAEEKPDATSLKMTIAGRDLIAPPLAPTPLGPRMRKLDAVLTLKGRVEGRRLIEALRLWSGNGGVLEVEQLDTIWGPLGVAGNATLALDGDMQPEGALGARMTGVFRALDAFADAEVMPISAASFAKVILRSLARTDPATGREVLDIAVTLQERTLYIGKVRIGTLPVVDWQTPLSGLLGFYDSAPDRPRLLK